MKGLCLKIPPALLMLVLGLIMVGIDELLPVFKQTWLWHEWAARSVFFLALLLIVAGVIGFKRARTTVDPTQPQNATVLVTTGIYRITRNPMYLGFLLMLLAFVFKLSNPITVIMLPVFIGYMNQFQINPEETVLTALFGAEYTDYQQQVRRWL